MKYILLSIYTITWFVGASAENITLNGLTFEVPDEALLWISLDDGLSCASLKGGDYHNETQAEFDEQCVSAPDDLKDCQPIVAEKSMKYLVLKAIIEKDCHAGYKNRSYDIAESGITTEELDASRKRYFTEECYIARMLQIKKEELKEKADKMKNCPEQYRKCTEDPDSYFKPKMDKAASLYRKYSKEIYDCAAKQIKFSKEK